MPARHIIEHAIAPSTAWSVEDLRAENDKARGAMIGFNDKTRRVTLYNWGKENTKPWKEVLASIGSDYGNFLTVKGGLILNERIGDSAWVGGANQYSPLVAQRVGVLLSLGVIRPRTKVWVGNWAGKSGRLLGSASALLRGKPIQKRKQLVLYHGTSSLRLPDILEHGLRPQPSEETRAWKRERNVTAHRNEAVYLSASIGQIEYYALIAARVDKYRTARAGKFSPPMYWDAYLKGIKATPVALKITLPASEYSKLRVDDDFWKTSGVPTLPTEEQPELIPAMTWTDSVEKYSQVAFRGVIRPEWIEQIPFESTAQRVIESLLEEL